MTSPRLAKDVESYIPPSPFVNDPPWNHTITGRLSSRGVEGVHTLRVKQSSSVILPNSVAPPLSCRQGGPNRVASRTPSQCFAGSGGRNRRGPRGGAAYGI